MIKQLTSFTEWLSSFLCSGGTSCLRTLSPLVIVPWNSAHKPHWPPKPGDVEEFPGSHKNLDTREGYRLLSVRYQWTGVRQRKSTKIYPLATIPRQHLCRLLKCVKPEGRFPQAKVHGPAKWSFSQTDWGGSLPRSVSLIDKVSWDPRKQGSMISRARQASVGGSDKIWVSRLKKQTNKNKTEVPVVCRSSLLGDAGTVMWQRECAKMVHMGWSEAKGESKRKKKLKIKETKKRGKNEGENGNHWL